MRIFIVLMLLSAGIVHGAPTVDMQRLAGGTGVWFEENRGQVDPTARFFARGRGYNLYLHTSEATVALWGPAGTGGAREASLLTMRLLDARKGATIEGADANADRSSYFVGNDPSLWVKSTPHYESVRARGVWRGVDVRYYENGRRLIEHDFIVAPDADAGQIRFRFDGATAVRMDEGALVIETEAGTVRWERPEAYQEVDGARRAVACNYRMDEGGVVDFEVGEYDRALPLVIDPELVYARFVGGEGNDIVTDLVYRPGADELVIVGNTTSPDLPLVSAYRTLIGERDAFLLRTSPAGPKQFTYIGGFGDDAAASVAVDTAGNAYVTGTTRSSDFPVQGGVFPPSQNYSYIRSYVLKLASSGTVLAYSSLVAGNGETAAKAIAVDSTGNAYITGTTAATDFPVTTGVFQAIRSAQQYSQLDAFIAKLNPAGSALVYASYLGGTDEDAGNAIAANAAGEAFVAGTTKSVSLATLGAFRTAPLAKDAFVARISANGTSKIYFTYFGGSGDDEGTALALDGSIAILGGNTASTNLPVVDATQAASGGSVDGFVAVFDAAGTSPTFATYLGGYPDDTVADLAASGASSIVVAGTTASGNFPGVDRVQRAGLVGQTDGFVTWIRANPVYSVAFSTSFGAPGTDLEAVTAVSIDPADVANRIYVGGWTSSLAFPADVRNAKEFIAHRAPSSSFSSQNDGFHARFSSATGACSPEMWVEPSASGSEVLVGARDRFNPNTPLQARLKIRSPHNCNWTLTNPGSWITPPATAGFGVDVLTLRIEPNSTGLLRSSAITISPGGGSVTVTQGAECNYSWSSHGASLPQGGGSQILTLTTGSAGCVWDIVSTPLPAWLSVTQTGGASKRGSATFSIAATSPNPKPFSRVFNLDFGAGGELPINQQGCGYSFSQLGVLPAAGATRPLTITTGPGCAWDLSNRSDWLTFSPLNGTGTATVQLTATANSTGFSRFGSASLGGNQTISVRQASRDCTYSTDPGTLSVGYRGGPVRVPVRTEPGCRWSVSSSTFSGSSFGHSGPATAILDFGVNLNTAPRTGTFEIRDEFNNPTGITFPVQQAGLPTTTPVVLGSSGSGVGRFTFSFADASGASDLNILNVLINDALDGRRACYLAFVVPTQSLYLVNDAGDALQQPPMAVRNGFSGGAGFVANSQCSISGADSYWNTNQNRLDLTLSVTFGQSFGGRKVLYAAARDVALNNSLWVPTGIWDGVPPPTTTAPGVVTGSPVFGVGRGDRFSTTFRDTDGANDIQAVSVLINNAIDGRQACYFGYHRPSNTIQLVADSGTGHAGSLVLNGAGSVENSQCRINGAGTTATTVGNDLFLTVDISFKGAFAGDRLIYAGAVDNTTSSGWQPVGSFTVIP